VVLKPSHSNRDRPFAYLLVFSTFLASHNDVLSAHLPTVLRPELAGTHFFLQLRPANRLQIAPGVSIVIVGLGPSCFAM
jgi:hypothetical protein